ncbi:MAG: hypothetical protein ACRYHQ_24440 [Janthinobacterium lividum]
MTGNQAFAATVALLLGLGLLAVVFLTFSWIMSAREHIAELERKVVAHGLLEDISRRAKERLVKQRDEARGQVIAARAALKEGGEGP